MVFGLSVASLVEGSSSALSDLLDVVTDGVENAVSINVFGSASVLLAVAAALAVVVAFFGCCGAWKVSGRNSI